MAIKGVIHRRKLLALIVCGIALAAAGNLVSAATGRGARATAAAVFGKTVDVAPVSGTVFVQRPGGPSLPLHTETQIPLRTVLDARAGTVQVTSATAAAGPSRTGTFMGAVFRVLQGNGGVTQMRFVNEDFSDCTRATAARIRRHRPYRAYATADTGFVVIAHDATSTPAAGSATWQVSDECDGTRTTPKTGAVVLAVQQQRRTLYRGTTAVDFCHPAAARADYCLRVDSFESKGDFSFGVLRRGTPVPYQLCLSRRGGPARCTPYGMTYNPGIRYSVGVVECDQTLSSGTFLARWRVGGHPLGVPLTFTSTGPHRGSQGFCYNYPIPRFGQWMAAIRAQGVVDISSPGTKPLPLLTSRRIPAGSVIDARRGTVVLTVETSRAGGVAEGTFSEGQFSVHQPGRQQGLAILRLVGGSFAMCAGRAPDSTVRHLLSTNRAVFGTAGYNSTGAGFRVVGRYASVVGHGRIEWVTADECDGTQSRPVGAGAISVTNAFQSSVVNSGEDELDACSGPGPSPTYCLHVLSEPDGGTWGFGLGLARGVKQYDLCMSGPDGSDHCYAAAMTPDSHGRGIGDVTCSLNQGPGQYAVGWFLGTHELGTPLRFNAMQAVVPQLPAINCMLGTPPDSRLRRSVGVHGAAPRRLTSTEALRRP